MNSDNKPQVNNINDELDDIFKKCIFEIRNMKKLDEDMLNHIRKMNDKDKMSIIIEFNDIIDYFIECLQIMN